MTMTDDEREARETLQEMAKGRYGADALRVAPTILALLDRPALPKSANEIPDEVVERVVQAFWDDDGETLDATRRGLDVLWQWLAQPPAPEPVEAWAVKDGSGKHIATYDYREAAEAYLKSHGGDIQARIVRLVEDRDGR